MKLRTVDEGHGLGKDGLWDFIRDEVVKMLDERGIKLTSVDLVCFTWIQQRSYQEMVDDDKKAQEEEQDQSETDIIDLDLAFDFEHFDCVSEPVYITPATIWIGVMPDSLTAEIAHYASIDIMALLRKHDITDVEVAYRESEVYFTCGPLGPGPTLFSPVDDDHPLRDVIDNLSTAISLPICGLETSMQGTLGFYFRVGDELYAVTARHVLFDQDEPNDEVDDAIGPGKKVVLMGSEAFNDYIASIQDHIHSLIRQTESLNERAEDAAQRVELLRGGDDPEMWGRVLREIQRKLVKAEAKIDAMKPYLEEVKTKWGKVEDRIIGHVVWSPPIGTAAPSASSSLPFLEDFCVIKLVKEKFRNCGKNTLCLGPEISESSYKFQYLIHDNSRCRDRSHWFQYPDEGLLKLYDILSDSELRMIPPINPTPECSIPRRVIKRGCRTHTTVGGLSGYLSYVRRYILPSNEVVNSIEVAIHCLGYEPGPGSRFSSGGDSGSAIVDTRGRFVALLNGGAGKVDEPPDITYGIPMFWLWDRIRAKFPGARLDWDDSDS